MHLEPTLILIPAVAVLAPVLARLVGRWLRVSIVVFELVLGIVIGPSVLGWASENPFVETLADFGLAMLFFVAGTEIAFGSFRGRLGRRAGLGWIVSLVLGIGLGWLIAPGEAAIVIGIALCSTALGTLLPILRDAGELHTPFGRTVGALGAVGEFGPLIAISIFLGSRNPGLSTFVLIAFALIAAGAIWLAFRIPHGAMHAFVASTLHTSGQFAIRVVLLILAALVSLSIVFDLDFLLGAFTAGIIWRLLMRDAGEEDAAAVESKIEGVAFGFMVPVFFVYTGVTFDLQALLDEPSLFLLLPVGLAALLVIRGLPSTLAAPEGSTPRDRLSIALLGATGLPIIVAVTAIGVEEGVLSTGHQAALIATGMLSVLLFPVVAMALRGDRVAGDVLQDDMA